MNIEQIYTGCLAEAAYYIESKGEVAIIDPLRETKPYMDKAEKEGAKIKYVFETHFHADFVSGHIDLAKKSGADIVFGPTANPAYDVVVAKDNQEFKLGDVTIQVLHTPGHTMESTTYLLKDENGNQKAIFTGDTLFIGDVGRPDLAVKSDLSQADLASLLYDSLRNKIMTLPDDVVVYPGHGAGSACGKNMSKETYDSLGNQKKFNYALRADMSKDEFIKEVTEGLVTPPQYFPKNVMMNKMGYDSIDEVYEKGLVALDVDKFEEVANANSALVLDTRNQREVRKGYLPGSIFIGIDGNFAPWVGALITDIKHPIVFIADEGREEEVVTRLARVGYDNVLGYLKGGFQAWKDAGRDVTTVDWVSAQGLAEKVKAGQANVVDVRKNSEFLSQHVVIAENHPLDFISEEMKALDKDKEYYVHCAGGYRSMIAISILKSRGYDKLVDVDGGWKDIEQTDIDKTAYVCPSTLL